MTFDLNFLKNIIKNKNSNNICSITGAGNHEDYYDGYFLYEFLKENEIIKTHNYSDIKILNERCIEALIDILNTDQYSSLEEIPKTNIKLLIDFINI